MPRTKLTQKAIARLRAPDPSGKQTLHWDTELRGLGVLCSGVTNTKTFGVQRDLPGGRTRRITLAPTNVIQVDEARERARAVLADLYRGVDPKVRPAGRATLHEVLGAYIAARKDLREKSIKDYRATAERHLAPWLNLPLRTITAEMVRQRHEAIAAKVADGGRSSGAASANAALRLFGILWNFAAERAPDLGPSPTHQRRLWRKVPPRERLVRSDELPKFYAAVAALPSPVARDYILLMLFTGLRRAEAAGLRWGDIDFGAGVVRVPADSTKVGRKLDLPMTDIVRDLLVARRALGRESSGFIFPSHSASGHIEEPGYPLEAVAAATGIRISAHDLRRTYITVAESCDISPIALKALVNHSLGGDVTSGYVVMSTERLREPAQKVADRLKQLCQITAPEGVVTLRG
jgi:integrase